MALIEALAAKRTAIQEKWLTVPGNVRGAFWIMTAAVWLTAMAVSIKVLGKTMSPWQIVMLRSLFALAIITPALARQGFGKVLTRRPGMHLLRATVGFCGFTSMIFAVTHLDLALFTTLGFTRILFVILLAILFLGERLNVRRAAATGAGFLGVVITMQPGAGGGFDPWIFVALGSALFAAGVSTCIKNLTRTEAPITILFWAYALMSLMATGPALYYWRTPTLHELGIVVLIGLFTTLGQSCMVLGLRAGDATAVTPFDYTRLVYAAAIGFFLFGEVPTMATLAGAAVIIASTFYIALQSAKR